MVGAPLCLAVGNLIGPSTTGSAAEQLRTVHAHVATYLMASVLEAAGFALLGALGVGVAMLVRRRGAALATIGALLSLLGGAVMGGAVLTTALVQAALPVSDASALAVLQSSPTVGAPFEFAILTVVGGVLGVVALLIGRPVRIWVPILLLVGLLLSLVGGGPLGALLTVPTIVAAAILAGALLRSPATVALPTAPREAALA
jgi:hypothetical protein